MDECAISRNGSHDLAFESNGLGLEGIASVVRKDVTADWRSQKCQWRVYFTSSGNASFDYIRLLRGSRKCCMHGWNLSLC